MPAQRAGRHRPYLPRLDNLILGKFLISSPCQLEPVHMRQHLQSALRLNAL